MDTPENKEILERIGALEKKLELVYISAEKTRKYFLWTLIAGLVVTVLPLIGLAFVIPQFLSTLQVSQFGF